MLKKGDNANDFGEYILIYSKKIQQDRASRMMPEIAEKPEDINSEDQDFTSGNNPEEVFFRIREITETRITKSIVIIYCEVFSKRPYTNNLSDLQKKILIFPFTTSTTTARFKTY